MADKKIHCDDDGRKLADMSGVEPTSRLLGGFRRVPGRLREKTRPYDSPAAPPLTKKEERALIFNALLAALAVGFAFIAACALFLLFCTQIWLR